MDVSSMLLQVADVRDALTVIVAALLAFSVLIFSYGRVLAWLDKVNAVPAVADRGFPECEPLTSFAGDGMTVEEYMQDDSSDYVRFGYLSEYADASATQNNLSYDAAVALDGIVSRDYEEAVQVNAAIDSMGMGSNSNSFMSVDQVEWEGLTTAAEREQFYASRGLDFESAA